MISVGGCVPVRASVCAWVGVRACVVFVLMFWCGRGVAYVPCSKLLRNLVQLNLFNKSRNTSVDRKRCVAELKP